MLIHWPYIPLFHDYSDDWLIWFVVVVGIVGIEHSVLLGNLRWCCWLFHWRYRFPIPTKLTIDPFSILTIQWYWLTCWLLTSIDIVPIHYGVLRFDLPLGHVWFTFTFTLVVTDDDHSDWYIPLFLIHYIVVEITVDDSIYSILQLPICYRYIDPFRWWVFITGCRYYRCSILPILLPITGTPLRLLRFCLFYHVHYIDLTTFCSDCWFTFICYSDWLILTSDPVVDSPFIPAVTVFTVHVLRYAVTTTTVWFTLFILHVTVRCATTLHTTLQPRCPRSPFVAYILLRLPALRLPRFTAVTVPLPRFIHSDSDLHSHLPHSDYLSHCWSIVVVVTFDGYDWRRLRSAMPTTFYYYHLFGVHSLPFPIPRCHHTIPDYILGDDIYIPHSILIPHSPHSWPWLHIPIVDTLRCSSILILEVPFCHHTHHSFCISTLPQLHLLCRFYDYLPARFLRLHLRCSTFIYYRFDLFLPLLLRLPILHATLPTSIYIYIYRSIDSRWVHVRYIRSHRFVVLPIVLYARLPIPISWFTISLRLGRSYLPPPP